jgi:hypothetical protein
MPSSAWFVSSMSSQAFWSGGKSAAAAATGASNEVSGLGTDEVIMQVASLLQTCLKVSGIKSGKAPTGWPQELDLDAHQDQTRRRHRCISFALTVLKRLQEASTQLAALRSSSRNSSSSSSSSSVQQAPCYAAPALLQLAGGCITTLQQALAGALQDGDFERQHLIAKFLRHIDQQPPQNRRWLQQLLQLRLTQGEPHVTTPMLEAALLDTLQHVVLLGQQLQQLLLPGNKKAAAAALQGLQEKQQQLQQALRAALWRLSEAQDLEQQFLEWLQRLMESSSSSSGYAELQWHSTQKDAAIADLASKQPTAAYTVDGNARAAQQNEGWQTMPVGLATQLVGPQLLLQLREFGCALWSALPQQNCCNNAACTNLGSISEAKLVSAKGSRCSKCQVAR